ncbi:putative coenzyme A biosynthesis bifunctional protein CoaBC (Includes: Phosphopantothenoylcysteine decarboxylase; Phosphopantothenate--cysteine ligase) [Nitrospina gracilis 3/211]|uniref:Coenzyme A biosynthesis bifunctional protein CoaBC n=1 Tax=Nitrospina gracilis (strain 3/211) TaxID=1266370 RepID=M1YZJ8_NITG3|nr:MULTISPECIES: bifunctional phosphopantothenoylcysteine decarboxylase/phosphopantothenate--cysteine ligase CoaBC [Nitrospina]MCF8724023.1 phosphopantothenoylcysteine decarboxylase/phosphopantothenate--cysteine ligase [Nitrospina sp. Nb-3]CCQ91152.1 putative coenzyme A biosynthesis bifunctional protein CoaBC (Includes: Phosphopantothenoylcysteine decarboxylase; Phosphopantothenate--cysteine ligase) [Nitrospina gracilis 3/211]
MSSPMEGRKIVLGVSGGIAAYKAVELLRLLTKAGGEVYVVMTENAKQFITPLTFEALSGRPVYHKIFDSERSASMEHIRAAEHADLMVVAPATANTIGKMANGLADDPLSTLYAAFPGTVILAPAMNDQMWANQAVQANLVKLKMRGVFVVEPDSGELACGVTGLGRLADPQVIFDAVRKRLEQKQDWAGRRVLVTAGPTREPIDPVRFITNHSSGKMGYAIAAEAQKRGAVVTLISGPTSLGAPAGVEVVPCQRASEMRDLVMEHLENCDVLVMTAAVGDFAPADIQKEKIKKSGDRPLVLNLQPTPDILKEVAAKKTHQIVVGFAAESENVVQSALDKYQRKQLDLIVANDISAPGIGFQSDFNQVQLIRGVDNIETLPRLPKHEIAGILLDRIRDLSK